MLRHARLGSTGYCSFITTDLTAGRLHYSKEMRSSCYFNIKSLLNALKTIVYATTILNSSHSALIGYNTVHTVRGLKTAMLIFLSSANRCGIAIVIYLVPCLNTASVAKKRFYMKHLFLGYRYFDILLRIGLDRVLGNTGWVEGRD
jgi:hypothetical protein